MVASPWMVGKYSILLKEYDEKLSPAEIVFEHVELWVRILNLPLGWMNRSRGSRAMDLAGKVVQMDVDADGKACGAFLRARVAIQIDKPVRRGIFLRVNKNEDPRWFPIQYERLPYICFHCGLMGHSTMECPTPVGRNEDGKLPYDVNLRAPEEKKHRLQTFAAAAAESFGSGSSSGFRHSSRGTKSDSKGARSNDDGSRNSKSQVGDSGEPEVQSLLKKSGKEILQEEADGQPAAGKKLVFEAMEEDYRQGPRKRKSKPMARGTQTPDLNLPLGASHALVPVGTVSTRVNQLDGGGELNGDSMIETLKKQRRGTSHNTGSAAAASGSPRRAQ